MLGSILGPLMFGNFHASQGLPDQDAMSLGGGELSIPCGSSMGALCESTHLRTPHLERS